MENLNERVTQVMEGIDEEYVRIEHLQQQLNELVQQQEDKIRETINTLLPVMRKMQAMNHFFHGSDADMRSKLGPVFKHDRLNGLLYVLDLNNMMPRKIELSYDDESRMISFTALLREVEFPIIMKSLLIVLNHHKKAQNHFEESINELEAELEQFKDL